MKMSINENCHDCAQIANTNEIGARSFSHPACIDVCGNCGQLRLVDNSLFSRVFRGLIFLVGALAAVAETPAERVIRRLEALKVENVRLAWADMCARWPDRFEKDPEWLRMFEARRQRLLDSIKGDWGPFYGELPPVAGGQKFLDDLRAHLLANPLLDGDRLLARDATAEQGDENGGRADMIAVHGFSNAGGADDRSRTGLMQPA